MIERLRFIAELRRQGLPWKAIGRRLGLSASAAFMAAKRAGLVERRKSFAHYRRQGTVRRLHAKGLTDPEIADQMGVHPDTVLTWRKRLGLPPQADANKRGGNAAGAQRALAKIRRGS